MLYTGVTQVLAIHLHVVVDTVAPLLGQQVPGTGGGDEVVALPPLILH